MAIESEEFQERGHHTHTHRHTHAQTHTRTRTRTGDDLPLYGEDNDTTRPSGFFFCPPYPFFVLRGRIIEALAYWSGL